MRLTDLTPEERDVYRVAFAAALPHDIPFASIEEARSRGEGYARLAVLAWRAELVRQAAEQEREDASRDDS